MAPKYSQIGDHEQPESSTASKAVSDTRTNNVITQFQDIKKGSADEVVGLLIRMIFAESLAGNILIPSSSPSPAVSR